MCVFRYFFTLPGGLPPGVGVEHFSPLHMLWLGLVLLFCIGMVLVFRGLDSSGQQSMLQACAGVLLAAEFLRIFWPAVVGQFDPRYMLPLHLCSIMVFIETAAVLTGRPLLMELSYCLGMPGAFFALLTPESTELPLLNLWYLLFILSHTLLFLIPVLMLFAGFRPDWRRLPACFGVLMIIALVDGWVNRLLGANYLFLCSPPAGSLLDLFRGLPRSVYLLCALALLAFLWIFLYLPWLEKS